MGHRGKLFGIGIGPGDPELLTLKAINAIQKCCVIAIPKAGNGESTAFTIVEQYLDGKELIKCHFVMDKNMMKRKEARQIAANQIMGFLDSGKDVGFITLGDPTIYSTYMYIHKIIINKGFKTEIIPGITSYSAAAAALGIPLCEDNEPLTIIPAGSGDTENIEALFEYPGNKVIMKSGKNLARILIKLKESGYGDRTQIVYRVTMKGQQLCTSIEDYERLAEFGYFTIVIVKSNNKYMEEHLV